jgi:hypothetical protein
MSRGIIKKFNFFEKYFEVIIQNTSLFKAYAIKIYSTEILK